MVYPDSDRVPRVPSYSGIYSPSLAILYKGLSPSMVKLSNLILLSLMISFNVYPTTPLHPKMERFGLFPFRSPLLRESLRFLFLGVLRCFTSPRLLSIRSN